MHLSRLLALALFVFASSFTFFATQSGDSVMYLNLARDFVFADGWPTTDPYIYSVPNAALVWTHEHLSFVLFYLAHMGLGFPGLILLKILIWAAVFAIALAARPREHSTSWIWCALFVLAVLAGSFRFIERSSMFSDLILVTLTAYLLGKDRVDKPMILGLTALFFVWTQLHPGFPLGLGLLGLWSMHRVLVKRSQNALPCLWLLLPVAALAVHPDGMDGLIYPFRFALLEASIFKKYNYEWLPSYHPLFRSTPETMAFWLLSLISLYLVVRRRAWRDLNIWFAAFAFVSAIQAVRFVPWASFALLITIKPYARLEFLPAQPRRLGAVIASAVLLAVAAKNFIYGYNSSSGERLPKWELDPKFFPSKTVDFLLKNPIPGRLYNSHDFGSYLIWRGYRPIFHHGFMTDMNFYENDVMGVFQSQARFLELAAKYNWTMLLVEKNANFQYFYHILSPLPEWKLVAEDDAAYLIYRLPN